MKKQGLALVMVLVMLMGVAAQATGPMRAPSVKPELSFQGTTALCSALVRGNTTKDKVVATAKLWHGSICLGTWTKSGTSYVLVKGSAPVSKGKTYKLTVDYTINGVKQPQKAITRTCP